MTTDGERDVAEAEFIAGMGELLEADGFAPISGRILGLLMLSAEPRSLQELADALRVSRASVSINTRVLERVGAVERLTQPGDRRDYYHIAEDVHDRMMEIRMSRFQSTRQLLSAGMRTAAARGERVRERMEQFSRFFGHMEEAIRESRARWHGTGRNTRGDARRINGHE